VTLVTGAPNVQAGDLAAYAPPGTLLPGWEKPLETRSMFGGRYSSPGMLLSAAELGVGEDAGGLLILDRGRPGQPLPEVLPELDVLLELAITTNRPDCLCHLGIARELAAALGEPLHEPPAEIAAGYLSATSTALRVRVAVDDPPVCHRIMARVIEGVAVGESPDWLKKRLSAIGLRPINNVVDVTNFVTHELGHPLHAFDLERFTAVGGGERPATLVVRRARPGESLEGLDGKSRALDPSDTVIASGQVAVSLAGVMGGKTTAVETGTTTILLEAACWEPAGIRATSRRHGLRTDASSLYEKGLSDQVTPRALERAAGLIAEVCGGHVLRDLVDERPSPLSPVAPIEVTGAWLSDLLGYPVDLDEAATALARLGFAVEHDGERMRLQTPDFRRDVIIPEDVAEEVGRSLGYDRVPSTLPGRRVPVEHLAAEAPVEERVRDACLGAGFDEVIPYVFVRPEQAAWLPGSGDGRRPIALRNPLSDDMTHLRVSLLPGLCATLALNLHRGVEGPMIFELGRAFWEGERRGLPAGSTADGADLNLPPLPAEPLLLGLATQVEGGAEAAAAALRHCQALAAWVVRDLSGATAVTEPASLAGLRPGRAGRLLAAATPVGVLGELDAATLERFELRGRVVVGELRIDALVSAERRLAQYRPVPRFPAVVQDLSVTVPTSSLAGEALAIVRQTGGHLLEEVELRDEFRGERMGEGRKGWTFRLTFRSHDRTLTSEEVQGWQDAILIALRERLRAELRR
jgi:phenylalanyl-tRNA synthetase beta chain